MFPEKTFDGRVAVITGAAHSRRLQMRALRAGGGEGECEAMSKTEKEAEEVAWEPSEEWKRIQLTPEQKAELRAELQKRIDAAAAAGVYERLWELRGKVKWDLDLEELRRDRD